MRKLMFLIGIFILVMPAWSQRRSNTRDPAPAPGSRVPFETKESILFDDGKLDEYTTTDWDKDYTHKDNQVRYSASGAMLEQIEFTYNVDKGYITTKITRDVESRLRNRVVYQYEKDTDILLVEALVDNKGKTVSRYEYGYDKRGYCISRIIKNREGHKLAETKYTFDNTGKTITSETSGSEGVISSTEYRYDPQGNLIGQEVRGPDKKVTSTIRSVWQDGHEIRNEMFGVDGKVQRRETNEYGTEGELIRRTVENFQGESKQIMQYEYKFIAARRQS